MRETAAIYDCFAKKNGSSDKRGKFSDLKKAVRYMPVKFDKNSRHSYNNQVSPAIPPFSRQELTGIL
jgi:hypothetical protein